MNAKIVPIKRIFRGALQSLLRTLSVPLRTADPKAIASQWREFRIQCAFARNYPVSYALYIGRTHRNPVLDVILPSLLSIKAVAILDDALAQLIEEKRLKPDRRKYRYSANGRIRYFGDQGFLSNATALLEANERRHELAHSWKGESDWKTLDDDIAQIDSALHTLGFLKAPSPIFEHFAERSAMDPVEPGMFGSEGASYRQTFTVALKSAGKPVADITWTEILGPL